LLKPQKGEIRLFGEALSTQKPQVFSKIGALIESPSLYPQLNAQDNLRLACKYHGISNKGIDGILEKVGLLAHQKKRSKNYSTGMKQRLGLAMALIHNPDLLILDEPTNGLDPQGITEIRNIIQQLNQEGKTIMLSSHLLTEIERVATHVGIIKDGALTFEGTLEELDQFDVLSSNQHTAQLQLDHKAALPKLINQLVNEGVELYEVKILKSDLEEMFIQTKTHHEKSIEYIISRITENEKLSSALDCFGDDVFYGVFGVYGTSNGHTLDG